MSRISNEQRKRLPAEVFGLPRERKYPINNKIHAANAKARATQQVKRGNLSAASKKKVDAKANRVLRGKKG